jgi:hypothetical protein
MMEGISLRQMQVNQTGTVVRVKARGELGRRIRDMGLVPGKGRAQLLKTVADHVGSRPAPLKISYGRDIDDTLDEMEERIRSDQFLTDQYPSRWIVTHRFLGISIVLWAMMTFPQLDTRTVSNENTAELHTSAVETMDPGAAALRYSIAGRMAFNTLLALSLSIVFYQTATWMMS